MSTCRQQALIDGSVESIWKLLGDPRRHPEWWPRVIEVSGERFDEGDTYAQVTRSPTGRQRTILSVEQLEDLREIHMRCTDTGMYAHWWLTEARDATFVEAEMGMDPHGVTNRLFDATLGRAYFRRWLEQSVDSLREAVERTP